MAKIYLAAAYHRREDAKLARRWLTGWGHQVTSSWVWRQDDQEDEINEAAMEIPFSSHARAIALQDLADLDEADVLLAFTERSDSAFGRGGRHVEFGYALARNKIVVVVGPRENVFMTLPTVRLFTHFPDALEWLRGLDCACPWCRYELKCQFRGSGYNLGKAIPGAVCRHCPERCDRPRISPLTED